MNCWPTGSGHSITAIAASRNQAPGTPAGVQFQGIGAPAINGQGVVALLFPEAKYFGKGGIAVPNE
jgi:hypothetical protein